MRNCLYEVTLIKDLDGHLDYLILAFVFLNKDKSVRVKRKSTKLELFLESDPHFCFITITPIHFQTEASGSVNGSGNIMVILH